MFYRFILRPILFLFAPESIHQFTFLIFRKLPFAGFLFNPFSPKRNDRLNDKVSLWNLSFPHKIGLAAGMDKDARVMRFFRNMGFAFVEIGTITPLPQSGNPKPRLFRLIKDKAMINRMGFNNKGIAGATKQLQKRPSGLIVGGNIGKNTQTPNDEAWKDYLTCFKALYDFVDYFVVNVSCPNIKDLSRLQNKESLNEILGHLIRERTVHPVWKPILLKVSPDLSENQLTELSEVVKFNQLDGLVATNTSILRNGLSYSTDEIEAYGSGGLSGQPLSERSTQVIRFLHQQLPDIPIIASGGIMTPEDAVEKLAAGASLVQIYTGFIYRGPGLLRDIRTAIHALSDE